MRTLDFDELIGELREFHGRVIGLDIRDEDGTGLIARAEGEFGHLEETGGGWSFSLGADPPPAGFVSASHVTVHIDPERVREVVDSATGIGRPINLHVRLDCGVQIVLGPAMPPEQQWTEQHHDNR